ncbi:hypothetical protein ACJX0J_030291 [Zea mays]
MLPRSMLDDPWVGQYILMWLGHNYLIPLCSIDCICLVKNHPEEEESCVPSLKSVSLESAKLKNSLPQQAQHVFSMRLLPSSKESSS